MVVLHLQLDVIFAALDAHLLRHTFLSSNRFTAGDVSVLTRLFVDNFILTVSSLLCPQPVSVYVTPAPCSTTSTRPSTHPSPGTR